MQLRLDTMSHLPRKVNSLLRQASGADLGGGCRGCAPPLPEMTCGFLMQLVFCKKKTMWFIGVEAEQETSAAPPKKNPGFAPGPQDTLRNFPVSPIKFQQHNFGFN